MCGRFNVDDEGMDEAYERLIGGPFPGEANFNTAPTETAWIIRRQRRAEAPNQWAAAEAKWWLTPFWSQTPKPKFATFNAKAETLGTSRTFREPFRRRRCLVPVTGFYEWRKREQRTLFGEAAGKAATASEPYFVRPRSGVLLLGGVWDRWGRGDEAFDSFAIVTTAVSEPLAFLHDRQPLMLSWKDARLWLDTEGDEPALNALLKPRLPVPLRAAPVSAYVGDPRNKGPRCGAPVGEATAIAADG